MLFGLQSELALEGPNYSDYAEDPIKAFGNIMQATIIATCGRIPGKTRGALAEALEIPKMTAANALEKLMEVGLIVADPPRDVAVRGQRVRCSVDDAQVTEMVMRLEQVLGES